MTRKLSWCLSHPPSLTSLSNYIALPAIASTSHSMLLHSFCLAGSDAALLGKADLDNVLSSCFLHQAGWLLQYQLPPLNREKDCPGSLQYALLFSQAEKKAKNIANYIHTCEFDHSKEKCNTRHWPVLAVQNFCFCCWNLLHRRAGWFSPMCVEGGWMPN